MLNKKLNGAVLESYKKYLERGERSPEKLKPLHGFISKSIKEGLGDGYEVKSLGYGPGKEEKFRGGLYDKNVDIAISKEEKQIGAIAVKFVTSNYSQNANNYIENMIGETFNIRSADIIYSQVLIIKNPLPYLNRDKTVGKIETIHSEKIGKYKKLLEIKKDQLAVPNSLFFKLIDTCDSDIYQKHIDTRHIVKDEDINNALLRNASVKDFDIGAVEDIDNDVKKFYEQHSDFEKFILNLTETIYNIM